MNSKMHRKSDSESSEFVAKISLETLRPRLANNLAIDQSIATFATGIIGSAAGILISNIENARALKASGQQVILLLKDSYEPNWMVHVAGMDGIVIVKNKISGHLAIMLQNAGTPAVIGLREGELPLEGELITLALHVSEHNTIEGKIILGEQEVLPPDQNYSSSLLTTPTVPKVFANASNLIELQNAIALGADGIGLVRTEHLLPAEEDLTVLQRLLIEVPQSADSLRKFKLNQFHEIKQLLSNAQNETDFPLIIRLLDPPYEELLDRHGQLKFEEIYSTQNYRGVQLAKQILGLYQTQIQAIVDAITQVEYHGEIKLVVPHVENKKEMIWVHDMLISSFGGQIPNNIKLVAAVESIRGVENCCQIAQVARGILIAMNDLTAEVVGCSRDNSDGIQQWMNLHKQPNPFNSVVVPVREVVVKIVSEARRGNPDITFSTPSGQVAGDKDSIKFCADLGFESISIPANDALFAQTRWLVRQTYL